MQTGPKLKIVTYPVDLDWVAEMCAAYQTQCEVPDCKSPAVAPFLSMYALALVCEWHDKYVKSLSNPTDFGLKVARHMRSCLLQKSYVYQNNRSGFELERKVGALQGAIEGTDARRKKASQAEIRAARQAFIESQLRIGAPDDVLVSLRTGRATTSRSRAKATDLLEPVRIVAVGADSIFPVLEIF